MRRAAAFTLALALAAGQASRDAGAQEAPRACFGDLSANGTPMLPGPPVRYGITPAGEAGALGPHVDPAPIDQAKTLAALDRLRPPGAPFVLRLNEHQTRVYFEAGGGRLGMVITADAGISWTAPTIVPIPPSVTGVARVSALVDRGSIYCFTGWQAGDGGNLGLFPIGSAPT